MKAKLLMIGLLAVGFGLVGCQSSKTIGENAEINASLKGAPDWVIKGGKDLLSATGSAKVKNNNLNMATTQAEAAARVAIASNIASQVESKYRELATSTEESVNQEAVQAIRISVNQTLAGTKTTQKWISEDGTLWVLVETQKLDTKLLKNNLLNKNSLDKEAAKALAQAVDEILDMKN